MALTFNTARAPGKYVLERRTFKAGTGGEREITYLGRVSVYSAYSSVDKGLLDKLTDEEKELLKQKLSNNEPRPLDWMASLKLSISAYTAKIAQIPDENKAEAALLLKELEAGWEGFLDAARGAGIKRTRKVAEKPAEAPKAPAKPRKHGA